MCACDIIESGSGLAKGVIRQTGASKPDCSALVKIKLISDN